ncbi:hypothetical protein AGMMS49957_03880 [Synergistales bacterium]|nr:hypothetical protein AGMMS49957_03880 [Synergistales bacterium]
MLFPGNRVLYDGKERPTINGERGLNHKISDRFDLTVECIRRFYNGEESPLHGCLNRYSGYFAIFDNFEGYIKFFLLQDIVNENYTVVKMFTEFNPDFKMKPVPQTADVYRDYMENTINFLNKRNKRMLNWVQSNCAEG